MNKGFSFTPDDALAASVADLLATIPSEVLEVWKSTIVDHLTNGQSKFYQAVLIRAFSERMGEAETYHRCGKWLKAVDIFRMQGWKVECIDACFIFERSVQPTQQQQQQQHPVSPACVAACAAVTKVDGMPLEVIAVRNKLIIN